MLIDHVTWRLLVALATVYFWARLWYVHKNMGAGVLTQIASAKGGRYVVGTEIIDLRGVSHITYSAYVARKLLKIE